MNQKDNVSSTEQLNDEFGQTGKLNFKSPKAIEFERYKQDCRKRALDLAHSQVTSPVFQRFIEDNKFVSVDENSVSDKAPVIADDILMGLADKYYQWLISIPETK